MVTGSLASGGVSTGGATALLNVKTATATSYTERVALVSSLTETSRSFCLKINNTLDNRRESREREKRERDHHCSDCEDDAYQKKPKEYVADYV
ncbi:unnamed protein product [Cochlearia groenlandica]